MVRRGRRAVRVSGLVGGVLAAGVVLSGCGSANADDATPEHKTFSLKGKELTVDSDNSEIELVPGGSGKDVKVTRWFDGWAMGGSAGVTWRMEGDTLKLRMNCKGLTVGCDAKHRIEVPRGVAVTVKDDNGAVTAHGFDTTLKITSTNGSVDVNDAKGPVDLKTTNGSLSAKGLDSQQVSAVTKNGQIRLGLNRVPDSVRTDSDNGATTITLPRAPYKVDATSHNGQVKVEVPRDDASRHTVSARSENGGIQVRTAD
ncbi:hypothetical protein FHS39_001637 [Streptomyces olivoverticillatus]|uniref:DUF4097 domain-containing protein n=1 Tax=Streptomyces olivoverticillatus TaxID=66427 RepID=A0A7W7PIZ9_9ACTN|nr:DUF4097 family beta strand repeat-containing protein [Streptomyces olivoverticillatus]MBB4892626.1 hypothetical protein [Streptomyces olivoverticillatus]